MFFKINISTISHLPLGLQCVSFHTRTLYIFANSSLRATCPAHRDFDNPAIFFQKYNHEVTKYVISSRLLLLHFP